MLVRFPIVLEHPETENDAAMQKSFSTLRWMINKPVLRIACIRVHTVQATARVIRDPRLLLSQMSAYSSILLRKL